MRVLIIFGFIATLYVVSCREYRPHHRDNAPRKRYRDTKNKRGAGDYPFGLSFGGPSFSAFQSPSAPASSPFAGGFAGFGGLGGGSPLGLSPSPFGISSPSPSFSSLGSSGLGSLGSYGSISQPLSLGQNSGYTLSGSGVNLASLLGSQGSTSTSYSSPSIGLFTPSDKTGPVTFGAHGGITGQTQQYTPVYATSTQLGSNGYSSPAVSSSSQGPSIQAYSQPSSISLDALFRGNGVTYSSPSSSSSSSADLASHPVTSNYVIAAAPQSGGSAQSYSVPLAAVTSSSGGSPQSYGIPLSAVASSSGGSSQSYSVPLSAITSSSGGSTQSYNIPVSAVSSASSPTYSIAIPATYGAASSNSAGSSPSSTYQLSITPSAYSTSPLSSTSNGFTKYIPISSDGSTYLNKGPMSTYKLSTYASPSTQQKYSTGTKYAPSSASSQSVTSYGTPIMMFAIPSTSYGTPSHTSSSSSTQYISSSSGNASPSIGYAAASSYSSPSSISSSSSSHQTDSLQKSPTNSYGSSAPSYTSSNYGSSVGSSVESNSISGYKTQSPSSTSSLSNSIENYSTIGQSNTRDSGTDSSSSYSNQAPRYIRYPIGKPSPYINNDAEESMGSSYDTISYSEKY